MVPWWSLVLAFVAGLAAGVPGYRLTMGRPAGRAASATPAEPAAPEPALDQRSEPEDPAAAVDDVVAELERRVKGRRTEAE